MATLNFRRFCSLDVLRQVDASTLLKFLSQHVDYLATRGVRLPAEYDAGDGIPDKALVRVLFSPDETTPPDLANALYLVNELATQEGMDSLLEIAEAECLNLWEVDEDTAPADIAVRVYIHDPDILRRAHAEQYLIRPRSFEYFRSGKPRPDDFVIPNRERLEAMQESLDDWFEKKRRGRASRIRCFPKGTEAWFLIQHGNPLRREGSIEGDKRSSVVYRPEKSDVLVYDSVEGEMWANAASKNEKKLYCDTIGEFLFGDQNYFSDINKFTLEPLKIDRDLALLCEDVEGLESIKLREVEFRRGPLTHTLKARDLSSAFGSYIKPDGPTLDRAKFQILFSVSKAPRMVTLRMPNIAQYTRDSDSTCVEQWLRLRGYVQPRPE